ncbi:glycoside hydrolase family 43 protein [Bryobacter aggregatus]|uniref:glycoside hydrolase family 43 protein n=1 Tax=Bryobacter aggregatus TaxID=360054 RepID=UPI0004E1D376|nr:glycoside hydrolase family 43 protein [Bryobacter aggregatus]
MTNQKLFAQLLGLLVLCSALASAKDRYLFSFFRNNGEDGLYLAESTDGLNWTPLNGDKPVLKPEVGESRLIRDPSITLGPNGVYHMVWTTSWQGRTLGYASSRDLKTWSPQRTITPFGDSSDVLNCWAPELYYDAPSKSYLIIWASTFSGKFPATLGQGNKEYNHRLYSTKTKDFQSFSKAELFYDPGFIVIDGALFWDGKRYGMVAKNETQTPPAKYLFLTFADSLNGPWTPPSANISGPEWAEGASPLKIGDYWYIYFDKYRDHKYGAIRSKDLKTWEDVSAQIRLPKGMRHGTAFRAGRKQ